ncbi:MAG: cytochrome c3 family protein [Oxalobacteraceae bacterium]|nr:cytochrome c3 family protein [Oxalobacteraceae bacterium]
MGSSEWKRTIFRANCGMLAMWLALLCMPAQAEYADVVLNKRAEKAGVRPVIFPHWFHRIRFRCKVCHSELGFKMRAGSNDVLMADIIDGKFCGMCHNDRIAWGPVNCDLCHSGKPGLTSGINGGDSTAGPGRW